MTRRSNQAELAKSEETAPASSPQPSGADGSLAPHALPNEVGLEPEDLAVLPGRGKRGGSRRIAPAAAVLALLLLGVYSFTRGGPSEAADESPSAAAPGPVAAAPAPVAKPARKPAEPEALSEEEPTRNALPMMMAPPAADALSEAPDMGPNGPSVGRFPDLPPAVVSYLKSVESAAKGGRSTPAPDAAEPEAAEAPAAP
jgi:hypothetical protein